MPGSSRGRVVVITGASSGIGRGEALAFARLGADLVLGGPSRKELKAAAQECEKLGGRVLFQTVDPSDEASVERLAELAVEQFGRIDVWVNNAAPSLVSRFDKASSQAYRRDIEANVFGCIHGARAALKRFKTRGSGTLINNAAVYGTAAGLYSSAYAVAKSAIRGFSESLRLEFEGTGIDVCAVLPGGRGGELLSPAYQLEKAAAAIVLCAERPKPEVIIGESEGFLEALHAASQRAFARYEREQAEGRVLEEPVLTEPAEPVLPGLRPSRRRVGAAALAGVMALPAALWWLRKRERKGESLWRR